MDSFQELLQRNKDLDESKEGSGKKFELHKLQRDSEGKERYVKTSEDETILKSKIAQMGMDVGRELYNASFEERCDWIKKNKEEGNKLYQDKKITEAIDQYTKTLCGFDFKKTVAKDQRKQVEKELMVPILNNMAQCLIVDKKYERAL